MSAQARGDCYSLLGRFYTDHVLTPYPGCRPFFVNIEASLGHLAREVDLCVVHALDFIVPAVIHPLPKRSMGSGTTAAPSEKINGEVHATRT